MKTTDASQFHIRDRKYLYTSSHIARGPCRSPIKIEDRRGQLIKGNEYRLNEDTPTEEERPRYAFPRIDDKNKSIVARPVN